MADTYKPMDVFDSMTDSTFILKPAAQQKGVARGGAGKGDDGALSANGGYVPLLQGREPAESVVLRRRLFEEVWAPLEARLVAIEMQENNMGVREVCDFVDSAYTQIETKEKGRLTQPFAEIAAAVAYAGVNTGDHGKLFQSLQSELHSRGHHVALLESQYCGSLPNMNRWVLDQIGTSIHASAGDFSTAHGVGGGSRAVAYDLSLLGHWWADAAARDEAGQRRKIVVILQDLEGFPPMVIDDFVRIATGYCDAAPIVLVLGLATSYECVQQSLTKASIAMLNVERFNLQRSKQCIDAAVRSLLVDGAAVLAFGAEAYKSLLDQFLLYSFSIAGFVRKLKYAAMDFFYAQPLSVLASMATGAGVGVCPIRLCHDQAELVRMQRSVQRFLEHQAGRDGGEQYVRQALIDDVFLQDTVLLQMMRQLAAYRQGYGVGIDIAMEIQAMAPETTRKPIRTLHYYGLGQKFDECAHWRALLAVVRRLKPSEMEQLLRGLCRVAEQREGVDWALVSGGSTDVPRVLRDAAQLLASPESQTGSELSGLGGLPGLGEPPKRSRTRTGMESLPFRLFDSSISDAQLCALDKCCAAIEAALRACLRPYSDAPLSEVFYYRHSHLLDTTFSAQPRAAVQTALGKSHYYIDCDCCAAAGNSAAASDADDAGYGVRGADEEDQRIMPSMGDTSIAYRLHQECGRLINVYDWYSSFASVVESEGRSAHGAPGQSETQARFMRAVEEMRLLGFIKATQRKTDHVVRLTWGA
ncbi:Origin recognition complex subunit 3 [Coemansia biformis]|uniref:Origin recognition complex subunit 3 n=1 Tax=Coemansia biformis TaxID=1286918 RepID=A0A9W8CZ08_9FUNG|nr:Origin recognition complex subunit 3 [Coemansia biformis]